MQASCSADSDCQFLYECAQGACKHQEVFPLSFYSVLVYLLMGLCASLCNVSGISMGIFKMLILIIALNYNLDEATGLAQALVVGAALPNFFTVIFRRHPTIKTTLVNYRLLEVVIPCSLLGSVLGGTAQTFIPKLGQLILLVLIFSYFVYNFVQMLRKLNKNKKDKEGRQTLLSENTISVEEVKGAGVEKDGIATEPEQVKDGAEFTAEKQAIQTYENSVHLRDIFQSLLTFLVFEFISFLFQGKLPFYSVEKCSAWYPIGIAAIALVTLFYIYLLRMRFRKLFATYRRCNIIQEVELDQSRKFYSVIAGAFVAGLVQGILGMGCGTCIMLVLLSMEMDSTAASATSGYQILFTGSASLLEFYINGQVELLESAWFLGVCCVVGGLATLMLLKLLKRFNQVKVNRFLILVILGLCVMSILLTIPTVFRILDAEGWEGMTRIAFHC